MLLLVEPVFVCRFNLTDCKSARGLRTRTTMRLFLLKAEDAANFSRRRSLSEDAL
jgi:hypothetical protein